jgi:LacI family transcriptional regulator
VDAIKPRPNLQDVARHAGLSPATVSRVLNKTAPVSEDVRARVLASVEVLGFRPRSLHPSSVTRPKTISIIIADILNPYFAEIVRGIQDEAGAYGLTPILLDTCEDPNRELEFLRMSSGQAVSGVIVCASRLGISEFVAARGRSTLPMVIINRKLQLPNLSCVLTDLEIATYRGARHLIDLNHTRIAFLRGPSSSDASQARLAGAQRALKEAGLELVPEFCPPSFPGTDGGFQAMSILLALPADKRPTAVLAYNDLVALGVLHAVRAHNMRVPEDISVIGADDITIAAETNPPLTTISQPKHRMGRVAMQKLRRMMMGESPLEEGYTLMESPLIVRESTAPAPDKKGMEPVPPGQY